jgi:hypothetical protein
MMVTPVAAFVGQSSFLHVKTCVRDISLSDLNSFIKRAIVPSLGALPRTAIDLISLRGGALADYSGDAVQYFSSLRTPSSVIAGSALTALFVFASLTKPGEEKKRTRLDNTVLLLYHVLTLMSLMLSLNVLVTSTAASNILLLRDSAHATSTFALLSRDFPMEFVTARWSFYVSLLSFIWSICLRVLVEFKLLTKKRIRPAVTVVLALASLNFHLFSILNCRLRSHRNLFDMTIDFAKMYWRHSSAKVSPCKLLSIASVIGAVSLAVSMFVDPNKNSFGMADDNENAMKVK